MLTRSQRSEILTKPADLPAAASVRGRHGDVRRSSFLIWPAAASGTLQWRPRHRRSGDPARGVGAGRVVSADGGHRHCVVRSDPAAHVFKTMAGGPDAFEERFMEQGAMPASQRQLPR
jgi:hypothetical protein